MTQALVSKNDVQRAKVELDRMKRSLRGWLKYRTINDAIVAGALPTKKPLAYAREVIDQARDPVGDQKLAKQLYVLLSETLPGVQLPEPNIATNPQAAVQLARIALEGPPAISPQAQGAWYTSWPVLIVGGLMLTITTIVRTYADIAKDREEKACIAAGGCTDYGFWLKAGGVAALIWVAWNMGLKERVGKALRP